MGRWRGAHKRQEGFRVIAGKRQKGLEGDEMQVYKNKQGMRLMFIHIRREWKRRMNGWVQKGEET